MDQCVALITLAFSSDPAARWMFPDPHAFLEYFPRFVRVFGGAAFEQGSAHYIDGSAAALWLPPGTQPQEEALVGLIRDSVPARDQDAVFAVFEQMDQGHPTKPHWYLPLIGTDPGQQSKGYGSDLLSYALGICDQEGMPAYLEATSPRNVPLYQRHGFEVLGTIQAGNSPPITSMLRKPH
jgi:GNAT superfamily N-acetyltransferase